jgi:hypothetical protein
VRVIVGGGGAARAIADAPCDCTLLDSARDVVDYIVSFGHAAPADGTHGG